jgi:CrcB protein
MMAAYFWITVGSALGGIARYWCSTVVANVSGSAFPWGTLVVNVLGSFIIGYFGTLTGPEGRLYVPFEYRLFVMTGFCGGYTTFSSFSLQTLGLMQGAEWGLAAANVAASVALCLLAVWLGHLAAGAPLLKGP